MNYAFENIVETSEKVSWTVDEVMPVEAKLDFSRPFLPESLAPTQSLSFLSDEERLSLNHLSGNTYLNLFQFVEEYIVAMAVEHAQAELFDNQHRMRALLRFADEEIKHQQLFKRYREAFDRDYGHPCKVLDNPGEVAAFILDKSPIAVLILTLHLEIMTQAHYVQGIKDNKGIDSFFSSLLKHHWLEESQHAKIDYLQLQKLVESAPSQVIENAFDEYLAILDDFDGLLASQAKMDFENLQSKYGDRMLSESEIGAVVRNQHKGLRTTFLTSGMEHPNFISAIENISRTGAGKIAEHAERFR